MEITKRIPKPANVKPAAISTYNDKFRFGCEFEFYFHNSSTEALIDDLLSISGADLLINLKKVPDDEDKNHCLCLKYDSSLGGAGVEVSVPICSYDVLSHYIGYISYFIDKHEATTNEDTGFHIHISLDDEDAEVDFYAFMLLCDEASLMDNWGDRNRYSLNPMEILNNLPQEEAEELKNRKGRIWRIERRGKAHVEIRTIGGLFYHKKIPQIYKEIEEFKTIFERCTNSMKDDKKYVELLIEHKKIINSVDEDKRSRYFEFISSITPL
ncbi:MAG: hypothetical protein COB67_02460 [SAR324 cluster bacterium]|uniref:Amidoligase n=1 Tax=SAR324 cluster bacterium TaxID=2024889 RepID=A0A2A4TB09_9DELT|nr:MAG: hypothetical protein COB67_02460 [SAR324 cluster bacterium]